MTFSKLSWIKHLQGADLTDAEYRVLMAVAAYTDKRGQNAFPGTGRLANDCRMQERSVKRILRRLEEKGWLVVSHPGGNQYGKGLATVYALGKGDSTVTLKGDRTVTLAGSENAVNDARRVTLESTKGDPGSHSRVTAGSPHQILLSGPIHHSESQDSASRSARRRATGDTFEAAEETLAAELDLDAVERTMVTNMLESGQHPNAIRNKILKDRSWPEPKDVSDPVALPADWRPNRDNHRAARKLKIECFAFDDLVVQFRSDMTGQRRNDWHQTFAEYMNARAGDLAPDEQFGRTRDELRYQVRDKTAPREGTA